MLNRRGFLKLIGCSVIVPTALVGPVTANGFKQEFKDSGDSGDWLQSIIRDHAQKMEIKFETADQFLIEKVRQHFDELLSDLSRQRKIYQYMIVCDERINTPKVIDSGIFKTSIYLQELRMPTYRIFDLTFA